MRGSKEKRRLNSPRSRIMIDFLAALQPHGISIARGQGDKYKVGR